MCLLGIFVFDFDLRLVLFITLLLPLPKLVFFPSLKRFINQTTNCRLRTADLSCDHHHCIVRSIQPIHVSHKVLAGNCPDDFGLTCRIPTQRRIAVQQPFIHVTDMPHRRIFIHMDFLNDHAFFPLNLFFFE